MKISEEEFNRIYLFLKARYGIDMWKKKEIVAGRLEHYLQMNGFDSYTDYMNAVERDFTGEMEREMVNLLSTNHTFFMREADHFTFLKKEVLPWLKKKEARSKDLSIWCAAASTGQEPYTLAMLMIDFFGLEHGEWDTRILATDVSTEALQRAVRGVYTSEQIEPLPAAWKQRFFRMRPKEGLAEIASEVKQQVIFRKFNLMDSFPFRRKMQIIFLRNVMIYFDHKTRIELLQKIYEIMEPGGYLFIGKTETLEKGAAPFQVVESSVYRR